MAGGMTYSEAKRYLDHVLRATVPTYPATVYIRALTSLSGKGSSGTEASYSGYARQAIVRGTGVFTDPLATGRTSNVSAITFPQANSASADIVGFDIVDTASGAFTETYLFGTVTPARPVTVGKTIRFPAGALVVTA